MSEATAPRFGIQRIYVKDVSFESPASPGIFGAPWQPKVQVDLNTRTQSLNDSRYEVVLTINIKATDAADKPAYIAEIQQAGVFEIANLPQEHLPRTIATLCPTVLFPYAREALDSLILKGGFPPVSLAHVNFEAIYLQQEQRRRQQDQPGVPGAPLDPSTKH